MSPDLNADGPHDEIRLEQVFKISGVPTHTFVQPSHFDRLTVAVRTPGRGVIVEGPSGIGKSTAVTSVLQLLGLTSGVMSLSARSPSDIEMIEAFVTSPGFGVAVVDDFHRLPAALQTRLANLLKLLADAENQSDKLIVIGINQAGTPLIEAAPDLANRIDRIKFEAEPVSKLQQMVRQGCETLNIEIASVDSIVEGAHGSFYLAQLLCHEACLQAGVISRVGEFRAVETSYSAIRRQVMERQRTRFGPVLRSFARGNKFRPSGRAPYYHMLTWLGESESGAIDLTEEMRRHPNEKVSVKATIDNRGLDSLVADSQIATVFFYNPDNRLLAVEDPHVIFYLRNLDLAQFISEVGFTRVNYDRPYDIALSFAGEDREYADSLYDELNDRGMAVFYDKAEESRLLAEDVEKLLGPIYAADSDYVVLVMGPQYGFKRWTAFEGGRFKERISEGRVIAIWSTAMTPSYFDPNFDRGGLRYDPNGNLRDQSRLAATIIAEKVGSGT